MRGDGEPSDKKRGGSLARIRAEMSKQVHSSKFIAQDEENLRIFSANFVEPQQRSPLPIGYPRKPLQDITAILCPPNRESRKEPLRPCHSVVEATTSQIQTSEQCTLTVTKTVSATSKSSAIMATVSSEIQERSAEEVVLRPGVKESDKDVEVAAESSYQVKKNVVRAPSPPGDAAPRSPTSRQAKRRKPLAKPTPGQNVARFR